MFHFYKMRRLDHLLRRYPRFAHQCHVAGILLRDERRKGRGPQRIRLEAEIAEACERKVSPATTLAIAASRVATTGGGSTG